MLVISRKAPYSLCILSCVLFLSFSFSLCEESATPYIIGNNAIKVNPYRSSLNADKRENYFYWVRLRNAFYYLEEDQKLAKMETYFTPEEKNYYKKISYFGVPFFLFAAITLLILVIYLIDRFVFKHCQGPKNGVDESYLVIAGGITALGMLTCILFLCLVLWQTSEQNKFVDDITSNVKAKREELKKTFSATIDYQTKIQNTKYITTNTSYKTEILHLEDIKEGVSIQEDKMSRFINDINSLHKPLYGYDIAQFIIIIILSIIGIVSYCFNREWITWTVSFLLICFIIPGLITSGLEAVYTRLAADFCQEIGNSVTSRLIPSDSKSLGRYLSCPEKQTRKYINNAIYEMSTSFNVIWDEISRNTNGSILGTDKRDNEYFDSLKDNEKIDENTKNGLKNMIWTNHILGGLLVLSSCYSADSAINYVEEKFCFPVFSVMMFKILFSSLAMIGLLILGAGFNKMILVLRRKAKNALRGNKKFTDEVDELEEEDDSRF